MKRLLWFGLVLTWTSCGGDEIPPPEYPPIEVAKPEPLDDIRKKDNAAANANAYAEPVAPAPLAITVTAAPHTPIEGTLPTVEILEPKQGKKILKGNVKVRLRVKNWDTQEGGRHVHLIVDNEPYIPLYDVKKPIDLNELMKTALKKDLEPGTHVLRAFPGHPHHESVKSPKAFAWTVFHYQTPTAGFSRDEKAPLLTYSRPKGCVNQGEKVLLDFFVSNVERLSAEDVHVKFWIGDKVQGDITEWMPHYMENLPLGSLTIRLALVDKTNNVMAGPFNDTTRTVEVASQCPPTPHHALTPEVTK